jgi:hypothetical protein
VTNHPGVWLTLLEAIGGGLAFAVIGGLAFYYSGLLLLSIVSMLLPLAGGRARIFLDWRRKQKT